MRLALALADSTVGQTGMEPPAGAVLVHENQVVGIGAQLTPKDPPAEVTALKAAGARAAGATLYLTREPSVASAEALVAAGVAAVVAAVASPAAHPAARGGATLRAAGVAFDTGLLADIAHRLYEVPRKVAATGLPFVTLTASITWDGKIATAERDSKWISSDAALRDVHELRSRHAAILVGIGTALQDDPELTARVPHGRHPIRVICDSRLRLPVTARVVNDGKAPTWVYTSRAHDPARREALAARGVRVVVTAGANRVDVRDLARDLVAAGVPSLLVEGGGEMHAAFLEAELVDKIVLYVAPKLVGGRTAPTFLEGPGILRMADAIHLTDVAVEPVGPDLKLTGYPRYAASRPDSPGGRPRLAGP
jgi:diaminohydroxyphosphoribosylaminopyrimidine deaminase/5-amino-6-(5-phosphoribosylamino)uracil reductase